MILLAKAHIIIENSCRFLANYVENYIQYVCDVVFVNCSLTTFKEPMPPPYMTYRTSKDYVLSCVIKLVYLSECVSQLKQYNQPASASFKAADLELLS